MSYLLDALRKADQERHLGTVPGLDAVPEAFVEARHATPFWLACVIVAIVVLNVAVLGAVVWQWFERPTGPPVGAATSAVLDTGASPDGHSERQPLAGPDNDTPSARPNAAGRRHDPTPRSGRSSPSAKGRGAPMVSAPHAGGGPRSVGGGRSPRAQHQSAVRRPRRPMPLSGPGSGNVPLLRSLPQAVRRDLPEYDMNGLLYSSVPGMSFVLINGGRYHEGERIPGAGAVVSIDAEGVVVDYKGRRFRLSAPN